MKRFIYIVLALMIVASVSCKKETTYPGGGGTTAPTTGKIQFINNSSNPYELYIDGASQGVLAGSKYVYFTVKFGTHTCRVLQQSGYVLYPTDKSYTADVYNGHDAVVSFP